jgi:hypothetical protein
MSSTSFDDDVRSVLYRIAQQERAELDGQTREEYERWLAETNKPADSEDMSKFYEQVVEDL